uniref:Uncharacterized protein n=1 Tax=Arundo donax TaxID=35708 RepID=A0A0A9BBT3_ARUDO
MTGTSQYPYDTIRER